MGETNGVALRLATALANLLRRILDDSERRLAYSNRLDAAYLRGRRDLARTLLVRVEALAAVLREPPLRHDDDG